MAEVWDYAINLFTDDIWDYDIEELKDSDDYPLIIFDIRLKQDIMVYNDNNEEILLEKDSFIDNAELVIDFIDYPGQENNINITNNSLPVKIWWKLQVGNDEEYRYDMSEFLLEVPNITGVIHNYDTDETFTQNTLIIKDFNIEEDKDIIIKQFNRVFYSNTDHYLTLLDYSGRWLYINNIIDINNNIAILFYIYFGGENDPKIILQMREPMVKSAIE